METLANEKLVCQALRRNGIEPRHHCIAVTGKGSPMDDPDQYLRAFYMYDYIGGRYSLTSMVGLVTLGFSLGYEKIVEFLHGAAEMDLLAEEPDIRRNLPLLLALLGIWNHNYLGYPTVAVLPYSQALHRFPAHLQQCDMESNGKSIDRNGRKIAGKSGPVLWGEPGTNGQHAFYQLLHQVTEIVRWNLSDLSGASGEKTWRWLGLHRSKAVRQSPRPVRRPGNGKGGQKSE